MLRTEPDESMTDRAFGDDAASMPSTVRAERSVGSVNVGAALFRQAIGFTALAHLGSVLAACIWLAHTSYSAMWWVALASIPALLYGTPVLIYRLTTSWLHVADGRYSYGDPSCLPWLIGYRLQAAFDHIPLFEALLRLVPGLYSVWLRAWGSQIGRRVMVGPGAIVLDRGSYLIGDGTIIGSGAILTGHAATERHGRMELIVRRTEIGPGALIGGLSVVGPGVRIGAGAIVNGSVTLAPYVRIGAHARIGARTELAPGAVIHEGAEIGLMNRIGSGARVGANARTGEAVTLLPGAKVAPDERVAHGLTLGASPAHSDRHMPSTDAPKSGALGPETNAETPQGTQ